MGVNKIPNIYESTRWLTLVSFPTPSTRDETDSSRIPWIESFQRRCRTSSRRPLLGTPDRDRPRSGLFRTRQPSVLEEKVSEDVWVLYVGFSCRESVFSLKKEDPIERGPVDSETPKTSVIKVTDGSGRGRWELRVAVQIRRGWFGRQEGVKVLSRTTSNLDLKVRRQWFSYRNEETSVSYQVEGHRRSSFFCVK